MKRKMNKRKQNLSGTEIQVNDQVSIKELKKQRLLLTSQRAMVCKELDKSPLFSNEWFSAQVKATQLEEKLAELESMSSAQPGRRRVRSGNNFIGRGESQEEIDAVSSIDDLECAMVSEALKQYSF